MSLVPKGPTHPTVTFATRVYAVVRQIPEGSAISYGGVAALLGAPRAVRGVGRALGQLEDEDEVPWWRVVNRNGEVSIKGAPGLPSLQRQLLEAEGVAFNDRGRLDWDQFGWEGPHPAQGPASRASAHSSGEPE